MAEETNTILVLFNIILVLTFAGVGIYSGNVWMTHNQLKDFVKEMPTEVSVYKNTLDKNRIDILKKSNNCDYIQIKVEDDVTRIKCGWETAYEFKTYIIYESMWGEDENITNRRKTKSINISLINSTYDCNYFDNITMTNITKQCQKENHVEVNKYLQYYKGTSYNLAGDLDERYIVTPNGIKLNYYWKPTYTRDKTIIKLCFTKFNDELIKFDGIEEYDKQDNCYYYGYESGNLIIDPNWWEQAMTNTNCSSNDWNTYDNGSSTSGTDYNGSLRYGLNYENYIYSYLGFYHNSNTQRDEKCNSGATNNGATFVTGKIDNAYSFITNDYMTQTTSDLGTSWTIMAWVKINTLTTSGTVFSGQGVSGSGRYQGYLFYQGSTNNYFQCFGHPTDGYTVSTKISDNNWHLITCISDGLNRDLWYDTTHVKHYVGSNNAMWDTDRYIGRRDDGNYIDASIDEVLYSDSSLNDSLIISSFYNSGLGARYNTSNDNYYSIINDTGSTINWIIPTFNESNTNFNTTCRVSTDNRTTFTNWLTKANNSENISVTEGQWLSFDCNTTGNATETSLLSNFNLTIGYTEITPEENLTVNLSLHGFLRSITAELGSIINASANISNTVPYTVCIDVDHPQGGINVSCATNETSYDINITYFRRTENNASEESFNLTYNLNSYSNGFYYQESANISNQSGTDGDYLLLYNGNYNFNDNANDGDFDTLIQLDDTYYINYTKPINSLNTSLWLLKNVDSTTNYSIPISCWDYSSDKILFKLIGIAFIGSLYWDCYNGTNWINIENTENDNILYEEGMYWNITAYNEPTNNNTFYIKAHQRDIVNNIQFNLTTYNVSGDFIDYLKIYINGTLSNDIKYMSTSGSILINAFVDDVTYKQVDFVNEDTVNAGHISIPRTANVTNATLILSPISSTAINLNLPDTPFVVIEATNITQSAFTINDGAIYQFNDPLDSNATKWAFYINTTETEEVKRAKLYKTLFFGTDGTNPRASSTYIDTITGLKTTIGRDVDKRAYFLYKLAQRVGIQFSTQTLNVIYNITNAGTDNSIWSNLGAQGYGSDGDSATSSVYFPTTQLVNSVTKFNPGYYYNNEIGTSRTYDERDNPTTLRLYAFGGQDSGGYVNHQVILLTEGNLSLYSAGWSVTVLDYLVDNNIPKFELWDNFAVNDLWLEVATVDGIKEFQQSGIFNTTNKTDDFSTVINNYLDGAAFDSNGFTNVSIFVYSSSTGQLNISNISVTYTNNINPIILDKDIFWTYLNDSTDYVNVPITIEAGTTSVLEVSDIQYDYIGGNDTIAVTAHSTDYRANLTYNITYFYSGWNFSFPSSIIDFIEFTPKTATSQNVQPYGQTSTKPILNITTLNYGGKTADFYMKIDRELDSCINVETVVS